MTRLEVNENLALQRRTWVFERAGWVLLAALIAAAALGVFGGGWLAHRRAASPDGSLVVEYERFTRVRSPERLRVRLADVHAADERLRLVMDAAYLERVNVKSATPEPERVELGAGRVTYVFAVDGSSGPAAVTFEVEGERAGTAHGKIALGDAEARFEQFFFP
ncbi:MAG TPA: hypothetical protein VIN61_11360 [Gammaproteobacteria bacterium]